MSSPPENIFKLFVESIDFSKSKLVRFPSYIFLCGGAFAQSNRQKPKSCRDAFLRFVKGKRLSFEKNIVIAEKIINYYKNSKYKSLLDFERDLAELSSLTILFTESPGSIAELGSFSVLNTINKRLLVVINSEHSENDSFIWQGPIHHLQKSIQSLIDDNPVYVYEWENGRSVNFLESRNLSDNVTNILDKLSKSQILKPSQTNHLLLFIADIISIVQVANEDDIVFIVNSFFPNTDTPQIKKYISLLSAIKLIIRKRYSNNIFYHSSDDNKWINFAFLKDSPHNDRDRWSDYFRNIYQSSTTDKIRFAALQAHIRSLESNAELTV